jgi:hypothetical protein
MSLSAIDSFTSPKGTHPVQGRREQPEKPARGKPTPRSCYGGCVFKCIYCARVVIPSPYDHSAQRAENFDGWCEERFLVSPPPSPEKNSRSVSKKQNKNGKSTNSMKSNNNSCAFEAQSGWFSDRSPFDNLRRIVSDIEWPSIGYPIFDKTRFLGYLEIGILLYCDLSEASSVGAQIRAFVHFIKHVYRRSFLVLAEQGLFEIAEICVRAFGRGFPQVPLQGGIDSFLDDSINYMDQFERSQLLAQLGKLLSYVLSFAVFQEYNIDPTTNVKRYRDFSHLLETKPVTFAAGMARASLESLRVLLMNTKKFWLTGDITDLVFTEDRVTKWNLLFHKLKGDYAVLSNPAPFGVSVEVFEKEILACIDEGRYLSRNKQLLSSSETLVFERRFQEIQGLERDFKLIQLAQSKRDPPFALLINGPSSVGKSSIMHMMFAHFAKVSSLLGKPLETDQSFMYTRSVADEYWSGFNTYQWCIVLDDVAVALPSKAAEDPTLDEIIRIVNPMPWTPPQAELERKGRYPVCPKLFLASTNVKDLNASMWFSVPLAVQRRFPFVITVVPKDKYTKTSVHNTNPMLDVSNLEPYEGHYDDYWTFLVEKTVPGPQVGGAIHRVAAAFEPVLKTDSVSEFMKWFGAAIKQYYADTANLRDALGSYCKVPICPLCFGDRLFCGDVCNRAVKTVTVPLQVGVRDDAPQAPIAEDSSSSEEPKFSSYVCSEKWTRFFSLRFVWLWLYMSTINVFRSASVLCIRYNLVLFSRIFGYLAGRMEDYVLRRASRYLRRELYSSRVETFLKYTVYVVATATAAYGLFTLVSKRKEKKTKESEESTHELNGGVFSSNVPQPSNERANIWTWKERPALSNIDLSPAILSRGAISVNEQLEIFSRNCYYMVVDGGSGPTCFGRVLALGGQLYLTNAHFFQKRPLRMFLTKCAPNSAVGLRRTIQLNYGVNIILDEPNDIAVFRVVDLPSNRSLLEYMFKEDSLERPEFNAFRLTREEDGSITTSEIVCNVAARDMMVTRYGENLMLPTFRGTSKDQTREGDCGSPLIAIFNGRCVVVGLHVGCIQHPKIADRWRILSRRIDKNLIESLLTTFPAQAKVLPSVPLMTCEKTGEIALESLHRKSPFCYLSKNGSMEVFGSIPFREGSKSHVIKTLLGKDFVEATRDDGPLSIVDKMYAPVMRGYEPKHNSLKHMIQTSQGVDYKRLNKCRDAFLADIIHRLPPSEFELIKPLDIDSCVNGVAGVSYIDAMKRSTSAGFPWREVKHKHLIPVVDDSGLPTGRVRVTQEIADRVDGILEAYSEGRQFHPVFAASFKDEPVSKEKRDAAKTRIFCAAPMDFTIVVRKFLLPVIRVIQRNTAAFETAIGVQAQSKEWELKYRLITKFGEHRIVAGDYSKFDKKMSPAFTLAAFDILRALCERAGYTDTELTAIDCIAQDICFPTTDFFGDLVRFNGTNPSGHPLTVIINSIVNSLYMRYAYLHLNPFGVISDFQDNVSLLTYGDDNIMSVSEEITFFNHTTIQETLQLIDVEYTMPDKQQESLPFIHVSQTSFLKRSFRYDEDLQAIVGPLEHDSISKMLTSCVASKSFTAEQHMLAVVRSAMDEYFWYGKTIFEDRRAKFHQIMESQGLYEYAEYFNPLPTWLELAERYRLASEPFLNGDPYAVKCGVVQEDEASD